MTVDFAAVQSDAISAYSQQLSGLSTVLALSVVTKARQRQFWLYNGVAPNDTQWDEIDGALSNCLDELMTEVVVDGVPIGATLYWWAGLPNGYLDCSGQSVSKTTYPELWAILGYSFGGAGDNFNLPNCMGRVIVDNQGGHPLFGGLGNTGGAETHTLTVAEMPSHTHAIPRGSGAAANALAANRATQSSADVNTIAEGGGGAHNNLQPYIVGRTIIKAFNP